MLDWQIDTTWTLFLDRDGVINRRNFDGYITRIEDFHFLPNVLEAIEGLSQKFQRIIVVTNQQGIGKKIMTERNVLEIHAYMCDRVKDAGGRIDACYFASNLKGEESDRRKPNPAMANDAKKEFTEIDFQRSVMIGDTDSDLLFGKNLGMKTVLVKSDEMTKETPDLKVNDLKEFLMQLDL